MRMLNILISLLLTTQVFAAVSLPSGISKVGVNTDIDISSVPETLWSFSGVMVYPLSALATTIESSSASDAAAGIGARTVTVEGLGAGYVEQSETVTMNGASQVTLANTYLRINKAYVATVGSNKVNVGDIYFRQTTAGHIFNIPAGYNNDQCAFFTTPAGKPMLLTRAFFMPVNQSTATTVGVRLKYSTNVDPMKVIVYMGASSLGSGGYEFRPVTPIAIPPKTDVQLDVISNGTDNSIISGGFELVPARKP